MLLREICNILVSGIFEEPITYLKPGNVCRISDTHITLRTFIRGCIPTCTIVEECIYDSYRGYIKYGYYISKCLKESYKISGENTCLGTCIMLIPIAVSIGYLKSIEDEITLEKILQKATELLKRYSTCQDTIILYEALRKIKLSYVEKINPIPSLPDIHDRYYIEKIVREDITLWKLFKYCSHIDNCVRQTVTCYEDILELLKFFKNILRRYENIDNAILITYIYSLARFGDTLILRKDGYEKYREIRKIAMRLYYKIENEGLDKCYTDILKFHEYLKERRLNPGSTADYIAVMLSLYNLENSICKC